MLRDGQSSGVAKKPVDDRGARQRSEHNGARSSAAAPEVGPGIRNMAVPVPEPKTSVGLTIKIGLDDLVSAGLLPHEADRNMVAQQFRRIKRPVLNLAFEPGIPKAGNANVVMMTSALPKSGKTFCSINLAMSIALERDFGAVLVDADVLKPNVSRVLGLDSRPGLIDYLLNTEISIEDILVRTNLHDILVVPAGQRHREATELLASHRMQTFISQMSEMFPGRAIIVDTPPLLITNEAHVLAEHMGQIVLVIESGISTQDSVIEALNSLNRSKPVNAILNKSRESVFRQYGGGGYGGYGGYGNYGTHTAS